MVTSALYGRMRHSRCIDGPGDNLGCELDVLGRYMDGVICHSVRRPSTLTGHSHLGIYDWSERPYSLRSDKGCRVDNA